MMDSGRGQFLDIPIGEYLSDRSRLSGTILGLVEKEPEKFGQWMNGKDIDVPRPASARGLVTHAILTEGNAAFQERFARFPNRQEGLTEEKLIPEGVNPVTNEPYKTAKKTGRHIPQDPTDAGAFKSMRRASNFEKKFAKEWEKAHAGKTIWYPEDQPVIAAMVKAVRSNEFAASLLHPTGFSAEVTVHWRCHKSGVLLRARFDGLRRKEGQWTELKTLDPGRYGRLDTLDPQAVMRWVRDRGFARKSSMLHDGFEAATGERAEGWWIIVEAIEHDPRVSVVRDVYDSSLAELGRWGCKDARIRGYYDLARLAMEMRRHNDYRHDCVVDVVDGFPLPRPVTASMTYERQSATISAGKAVLGG